jgi:tetratricopeptide (TPR) repeat protein
MRNVFQSLVVLLLAACAWATPSNPSAEELLQSGRVDDAIAILNHRIAAKSDDAEAYNLLSRAHYALNNFDPAIKAGERAVSLAPNNAEYHLWLGRAYGRKAEHASWWTAASLAGKMRDEFERSIQLNGDDVGARTDLAEFYIEAPGIVGGGKDKAETQAKAVEMRDSSTAHWIRARVAEKDKRFDVAEAEYKAAIQDSGDRADNWLSLASFYRRRDRLPEMEAAINKAVASQKKAEGKSTFYDAATLLWKTGRQLPQAAQFLAKYLSSKDKVEDAPAFQAHYLLGQIYEKQGDRAAATREYQSALKLAKDYRDAREALARVAPVASATTQ